ncbi:MAG: dihydrodipicolinate synthase family protein [Tepidisphaeraceae bacterium]
MQMRIRSTSKLRGIIPPLVTPLLEDGTLDEAGLCRVVERAVEGGVHGLFVLGTTAEWASLDDATRLRVLELCATTTAGRVPLYLHVTDTRFSASLALARAGAEVGVAAIVAAAPYYLPLRQSELIGYIERFLDAQDLPIVLYNIPQFIKTSYEPETVRQLIQNPRVIGIKDSSGDLAYQREIIDLTAPRPDFSVLCGDERYMREMLAYGAHGCVGGGGNLLPRLLVSLYQSILANDAAQTEQLQHQLQRLSVLYEAPTVAAGIRNVKSALHQLGIIATDQMCAPYGAASDDPAAVRRVLQSVGLLEGEAPRPANGRHHAAISSAR